MTTETLHLPITALRAALQTAAKDDGRYYICGVLLERRDGCVRLVSTDGHVLFAYRVETEHPGEDLTLILPRDLLAPLRRPRVNASSTAAVTLTRETTANTGHFRIRIEANGIILEGLEVAGRFPDWRLVVPDTASGEPAQYDARLLSRFAAIGHELFGNADLAPFHIYANGKGPGLIRFLDDQDETALGVVMPFCSPAAEAQSWVRSMKGGDAREKNIGEGLTA